MNAIIWAAIKAYWRPLVVAGTLLAVAAGIGWYGHVQYRAGQADTQAQAAIQLADATQLARATEQARWAAREGIINDAKKQTAAALADADRAGVAAERLRKQLAELQRSTRDPATTGRGQGEQGTDTIGLLAQLYGRMEQDGRTISGYADQLKIAGLSCERAYASLR